MIMAMLLNKMHCLSKKIAANQIYSVKKQSFHANNGLFSETTFNEKPAWLKKFKLKQAAMQKNDGRPTFLKKGTPDKILYNLTLGMVIFGFFWSIKALHSLNYPPQQD